MDNTEKQEWFVIGTDSYGHDIKIRAWEPGDGLACSSDRNQKKAIMCTAPAAVISLYTNGGVRSARTTNYVVCGVHLTGRLREFLDGERISSFSSLAQKAAREKVLAAHWGEYQAAIADYLGEEQTRMLSKLPDELREAVEQAASREDCAA